MGLYKNFADIEIDKDRYEAMALFNRYVKSDNITDAIDKAELRTDIINHYIKKPSYNFD